MKVAAVIFEVCVFSAIESNLQSGWNINLESAPVGDGSFEPKYWKCILFFFEVDSIILIAMELFRVIGVTKLYIALKSGTRHKNEENGKKIRYFWNVCYV